MSLQYSNTTTKKGILQKIEKLLNFDYGYITDNTSRLLEWTVEVNLARNRFSVIAQKAANKWQVDDTSHTDYSIIELDLVSGQRDYAITVDQQGNLIGDIYKVLVKNPDGKYVDIDPVDQQSEADMSSFYDGQNLTGTPTRYDKTGNGVFLDLVPNYSYRIGTELERGLKLFVSREPTYYLSTDTTKVSGFAGGAFDEYFALYPAYNYATVNDLRKAPMLDKMIKEMEAEITEHYTFRDRATRKTMKPLLENNK